MAYMHYSLFVLSLLFTALLVSSVRDIATADMQKEKTPDNSPDNSYLGEQMKVWDEEFPDGARDEAHVTRGANHITRIVSDVHKSKEFYHGFLGLPLLNRPNFARDGYWLDFGNLQLHLIEAEDSHHASMEASHAEDVLPGSSYHVAVVANDFADTEMWIQKLGQPYQKFAYPYGDHEQENQIFVKDPDGHIIEICDGGVLVDVPIADRSSKVVSKATFTPDVSVSKFNGTGASLKGHFTKGVHHIGISAKDLEESIRFYHKYLKLPMDDHRQADKDVVAVVGLGGIELHLIKETVEGQAKIEAQHDSRPGAPKGNVNHLSFGITDFDAVQARLDRDNVKYMKVRVPVGKKAIQQLFTEDPDGNFVELCTCHLLSKFVYGGLDPEAEAEAADELATSYVEGTGDTLDESAAAETKKTTVDPEAEAKSAAVGKAVLPAVAVILMSSLYM